MMPKLKKLPAKKRNNFTTPLGRMTMNSKIKKEKKKKIKKRNKKRRKTRRKKRKRRRRRRRIS